MTLEKGDPDLIDSVINQTSGLSKKRHEKISKVAKTLNTSPEKVGRWAIVGWTGITLLCHFIISVMLFFPTFEYVFSVYFIDHFRGWVWSLWFISAVTPIVGILFVILGTFTSVFKSILYHSTNYQRAAFYMYWLTTIVAFTVVTTRSALVYDEYSGLGAPDTWVNFFAIRAYNMLGRECTFFFFILQIFALFSIYNWINSYKTALWNFTNLYSINEKLKDVLGDGFDVFDGHLLNNKVVQEMVDLADE